MHQRLRLQKRLRFAEERPQHENNLRRNENNLRSEQDTDRAVIVLLKWLRRQRHLIILDDGQRLLLSWGEKPQVVRRPEDLQAVAGSAIIPGRGWPQQATGGLFFLAPYEWTPEPYGAEIGPGHRQMPARCWRHRRSLQIDLSNGEILVTAPRGEVAVIVARLRRLLKRGSVLDLAVPRWRLVQPPDQQQHATMIAATQAAIAAGDCYQLNCTVPFVAQSASDSRQARPRQTDDVAVWWALRQQTPAAYGALLRWPGRSVVSYSPECLVQAADGYVWSSPIKGRDHRRMRLIWRRRKRMRQSWR